MRFLTLREGSIVVVTILAALYFAVKADRFATHANFVTLLPYFAPFAILAVGEVLLMVAGEIDLSIGSVYLFCPLTTCVTLTVVDVTSAPGIATGAAWEMISVRPPRPSSMPRVVMNDETPKTSVTTPLTIPTSAQHTSAKIRHSTSPSPAWLNS